jgi:hypothetical protein
MTRREAWRLPHGGEIPDDMIFRVDPPAEIGAVSVAWTNDGPSGPSARPLALTLWSLVGGASAGFAVGLVGFFVVGGLLEWTGPDAADAFLGSIVVGALGGAGISAIFALRRPNVLTIFVGEEGCAQISRFGADAKPEVLLFRDVESMRTHVRVMTAQGIRTAVREIHVRRRGEREKLWYVTAAPGEQKPDDPQYHWGEAVLRAFERHRARDAAGDQSPS